MTRGQKQNRTKKGKIHTIYHNQRRSSEKRGHPYPAYTKKDLYDWLMAQPLFHHLFHLWEVSNYDKLLVPSVDRIDDDLPYSFSNIQLMTWAENDAKGKSDTRSGLLKHGNKPQKAVIQCTIESEVVSEYVSLQEAHRETGIGIGEISKVCNNKRNHAGGYIWKFKEEA